MPIAADGALPGGVLRVFGWRGYAFYEALGDGVYRSPADDPGTLTGGPATGWVSTRPDGRRWEFDAAGRQTRWVGPDGAVIGYGYDAAGLLAVSRLPAAS